MDSYHGRPFGDPLQEEATFESLKASGTNRCYRCGQDPELAHDKSGFCPAFALLSHSGEWISLSRIMRVMRKYSPGSLSFWTQSRADDPEGRVSFHDIVGVAFDDRFLFRLDSPSMPEFSIYSTDRRGRWSPDPDHEALYAGWRRKLRALEKRFHLTPGTMFRALGVNPDVGTEEKMRWKQGWL